MATVHRICYPSPLRVDFLPEEEMGPASKRKSERKSKLHWLRDGDAGTYYATRLAAAGYDYRLEFNTPKPANITDRKGDRAAAAQDRLKKGDVLLVNNRPPLTRNETHLLADIVLSESWVEDRIMGILRNTFSVCSRDEVVLTDGVASMLQPDFEKRAKVRFKKRPEAEYSHKATVGGEYEEIHSHRTAGYLIYAREIWPNGPDLLCSFAMSGPMNLVWAHLVVTKLADHLLPAGKERILVADIVPTVVAHSRSVFPDWPDTLDFTCDWKVEPALDKSALRLWS
jgi:hypothetical protein